MSKNLFTLIVCFILSLFCIQPCFSQICPPPEDGPGGDHPDENVSVNSSINSEPYKLQTPDSISVLQGYYRDFITLSSAIKRANVYTDTQSATLDLLSTSKILVIPTGGVFGMEGSTFFREVLKEYVNKGGVIICFAQQHGYDFNILPRGNEIVAYGWLEDQNCQSASVSVEIDYPMFSGLTTNLPNVNVDGYFSQWPVDATVLLRRTKNVMPAMLMYPYGSGKVIVSSMYTDWAYGHGMASSDEIKIVRDLISWAKNTEKAIPTVAPGQSVTVPVEVKYNEIASAEPRNDATKVVFTIIDPDRNIITTQEQVVNITPGTSVTGTVHYGTVPSAKRGIWWVDYTLYDVGGNVVQEQTEGDRFAISTPVASVYKPGEFLMWATSDNYVSKGSQIVLSINVTNNTNADFVNGSIFLGVHEARQEGGVWWKDIGIIPNVLIPAHTTRTFTFPYTIYISSAFYIGLFPEGKSPTDLFMIGANLRTERGVWVVPASANVSIITDKVSYKRGDIANITVNLKNLQNISYNTNSTIRIFDPINTLIFTQNFSLPLGPNETKTQLLSFPISGDLKDGIYVIAVETFKDGEKIGTGASTFEIQNIRLGITVDISSISPIENSNISFTITNTGIVDIINAPVVLTFKDPNSVTLYKETKYFNLSVGATETINYTLPPFNLAFGKFTLSYSIEYGGKTIFGIEILDSSNSISLEFDKPSYAIRDTINMNLKITNTTKFNEAMNVNIKSDAIGLDNTKGINLLSGQSISIPYSSVISDTTPAGTYMVEVTLLLINSIKEAFYFTIPKSKLEFSLDTLNYNAGDNVNIKLNNTGGIDTTADYTVSLTDSGGKIISSINGTTGKIMPGLYGAINFTIPTNATDGEYRLSLQANDKVTAETITSKKILKINGLKVVLSSQTEKRIYRISEDIGINTNIVNSEREINNASLNLKITSAETAKEIIGKTKSWKNTEDFQAGELQGVTATAVDNPGVIQLVRKYSRDGRDFQGILPYAGGFLNDWGYFFGWSYEQAISILVAKVSPDQECHTQFISSYISSHGDALPMEIDPGIYTIWLYVVTGNPTGLPNPDKLTVKVGVNGTILKVFTPSDIEGWEHIGKIWLDKDSIISITSHILDQSWIPQIRAIYLTPDADEISGPTTTGKDGDRKYFHMNGVAKYKFNAGSNVIWNNISWVADTSSETKVKFRTRGANTETELNTAIWSEYLELSGMPILSDPSQWIEVEATLETTNRMRTPAIYEITVTANYPPAVDDSQHKSWKNIDELQTGMLDNLAVANTGLQLAKGYYRDGRDFQGILPYAGGFLNDWGYFFGWSYEQAISILVAKVSPDQECHTQFINSYISSHGDALPMEIDPGIYTIYLYTVTGNPTPPNPDKLTVKVGINGVVLKEFTPSDAGAWEYIGKIWLDKDSIISITSHILDSSWIPQIRGIYLSTNPTYKPPDITITGKDGDRKGYTKNGKAIYRFNAQSSVVWKNINWVANTPAGTKIKFRTRTAQSGYELLNAIWSDYYEISGSNITSNPGQWIEVEVTLETLDTLITPVLSSFTLGAENIPTLFAVWTKDIPVNIPANQTVNMNTQVDALGVVGKYYLDTRLISNLNQNISQTVSSFYITDKNITLTFKGDKKEYKPGENIIITGEAVNLGAEEAIDVNLILKAGDDVIYTEIFNIPANSSHSFTAITTSTNSFTLTGIVNVTTVSESIIVETPQIETIIDTKDIAGREPFNFDVTIKNTGKIDVNLGVSIAGEQAVNIFLLVGTQKLISKNITIDRDTTVDVVISGDVNQTIQKHILFGERAIVDIPVLSIYPEGTISLNYTVTNTGSLQTTEEINFVLFKNNQQIVTIQKKHTIPVSGSITDTLVLENLVAGTYILKYTTLFETNQLSFKVGKYNTASVRTDLGSFNGLLYPLTVYVKNIGANEFKGTLRITNKFLSAEEEISLLLDEEKTYTYNIIPKANGAGVYAIKIEVLFAGNVVVSETKDIVLIGPVFTYVSVPNNLIFDAASTNTLTFRIKNTGDIEGQGNLKLVMFDTLEQTKSVWLKPNEEADISFTFAIPEDMPDGDYSNIAKVTLNNVETALKIHVNGIKILVSTNLNKENYIEGETAEFTVNVTNISTGVFNLSARVQFNEYSDKKDFTSGVGTQTIVFSVPVKFTGQKLTYGIYFASSGRSIYLDSVYVNKKQDVITLTTDKQLYNPGESVLIKIESTQAGTISITAPNYTQTQDISIGTTTLSFTLAENMIAGTYAIEYTFAGVNYKYPFDVAGLIVRILEVKLDKPKPNPGEQVTLSLTSDSNKDITSATLKGWLIDASRITTEIFSESIYLIKGENKFNPQFTVATTSAGIHKIVYGIYDANNILLVSGSKSFDVGTATLLGCSTDKIDYPLGTEQVNAIVTLFGQSGVNTTLTIYLDDNFILTQNITTTGATQETTIPIQVQTPGWHIVKADLSTDGLVSTKETRFIYGSSLADLTISSSDIIIEHPVNEFHGIQYDIETKVYNTGKQDANNVVVRFYDGNPDAGGLYIGETTIQKISGKGGSGIAKVRWDATGKTGEHTIFVVVNPDNIIRELDTTNNKATKSITVYKVWVKHWEGDFVGTGSIEGPRDRHKVYNYSTKRLGKVNLVKTTVKVLVKEYENDGSEMTDKINPYLEVWSMEKQKKEKGKWKCFRHGRWIDTHQINGSITPIDIGWYKFSSTDPEVLSDISDERHDHIDLWIKSLDAGKSGVKHSKDKVKIDKVNLYIEYE